VKLHASFSQVSQFRKLSQLLVKKTTYVWTYSLMTTFHELLTNLFSALHLFLLTFLVTCWSMLQKLTLLLL
jgi:hypothetical protein